MIWGKRPNSKHLGFAVLNGWVGSLLKPSHPESICVHLPQTSPSLPWRLEKVWVVAQQTTQWGSGGQWKEVKHLLPSPIPFAGPPLFTFPALTGEPRERSTTEQLPTHTQHVENQRALSRWFKTHSEMEPPPFSCTYSVMGPQSEICAYIFPSFSRMPSTSL